MGLAPYASGAISGPRATCQPRAAHSTTASAMVVMGSFSDSYPRVFQYPELASRRCTGQRLRQARPNLENRVSCLVGQPENHYSGVIPWRIQPEIGEVRVLRYQDAVLSEADRQDI